MLEFTRSFRICVIDKKMIFQLTEKFKTFSNYIGSENDKVFLLLHYGFSGSLKASKVTPNYESSLAYTFDTHMRIQCATRKPGETATLQNLIKKTGSTLLHMIPHLTFKLEDDASPSKNINHHGN